MDPVPDPLLLRKSGSAGNRTGTSGLAVRNSDQWTTEYIYIYIYIYEEKHKCKPKALIQNLKQY
jgi:hypothetical protein